MKHNLQFDFIADKKKNTLTIMREFLADGNWFGIVIPRVNCLTI